MSYPTNIKREGDGNESATFFDMFLARCIMYKKCIKIVWVIFANPIYNDLLLWYNKSTK